jgi:hypothetical protein
VDQGTRRWTAGAHQGRSPGPLEPRRNLQHLAIGLPQAWDLHRLARLHPGTLKAAPRLLQCLRRTPRPHPRRLLTLA